MSSLTRTSCCALRPRVAPLARPPLARSTAASRSRQHAVNVVAFRIIGVIWTRWSNLSGASLEIQSISQEIKPTAQDDFDSSNQVPKSPGQSSSREIGPPGPDDSDYSDLFGRGQVPKAVSPLLWYVYRDSHRCEQLTSLADEFLNWRKGVKEGPTPEIMAALDTITDK
eukprot:gene13795-19704_t